MDVTKIPFNALINLTAQNSDSTVLSLEFSEDKKNQSSALFYIGDMPDDMVAASKSAAGFKAIGILVSAPDKNSLKKELLRAGADYIVEDFEELMEILKTE